MSSKFKHFHKFSIFYWFEMLYVKTINTLSVICIKKYILNVPFTLWFIHDVLITQVFNLNVIKSTLPFILFLCYGPAWFFSTLVAFKIVTLLSTSGKFILKLLGVILFILLEVYSTVGRPYSTNHGLKTFGEKLCCCRHTM